MANSLKSLIKTGFGLGLGVYAAQLVFLVIGLIVFFPGYLMYQEKTRDNAPQSEKIFPFALMAIGVVIMGGTGLYYLLESGADLFE